MGGFGLVLVLVLVLERGFFFRFFGVFFPAGEGWKHVPDALGVSFVGSCWEQKSV